MPSENKAAGKKTSKKSAKKKGAPKVKSTAVYKSSPNNHNYNDDSDLEEESLDSREAYMTLGDHLEELRHRIIAILIVVFLGAVVAIFFVKYLHEFFLIVPYKEVVEDHLKKAPEGLLIGGVGGPFFTMLKLAVMISFTVTLPVSISILWSFVTPALSRFASIIGHILVIASSGLFYLGLYVCWKFIFKLALYFMMIQWLPALVDPRPTLELYYSFLFMLHIGAGLGFQLPLVIVILGAIGIMPISWHKNNWRTIVIATFVFAAVITPPDPITQLIMATSLLALYCLAISVVWIIEFFRRKRRKKEEGDLRAH